MKLYVLSGGNCGIVETIAPLLDYAVDVQRAGSAENDLEQYFTLHALTPRLGGIYRTRFKNDFDRLQGRRFLNLLRSRATNCCDYVIESARHYDDTIAASVWARTSRRIAESGCPNGAADAMGSARAIAFSGSCGQVAGTDA